MRRRYIEVNQLLSNSYKSEEVYIRSTDTNRTIASALSFFKGFYPDSTGPSVRPGVNARPPFVVQNIEKIEAELGLSALPNNA
mmetsp:Transcript_9529/g.1420  ORF Transcript_9529/g.1420 Transcript_9529/m.1420 type:complete len:83 (+) Transcript_9529:187-435(+)